MVNILLDDSGLCMCEDCHTSYIDNLDGGLNRDGTFIEFTKNLIDELNAFWDKSFPPTYNSLNMGGIHFYTSIVVIEKKQISFTPFDLHIGKEATVAMFEDTL